MIIVLKCRIPFLFLFSKKWWDFITGIQNRLSEKQTGKNLIRLLYFFFGGGGVRKINIFGSMMKLWMFLGLLGGHLIHFRAFS